MTDELHRVALLAGWFALISILAVGGGSAVRKKPKRLESSAALLRTMVEYAAMAPRVTWFELPAKASAATTWPERSSTLAATQLNPGMSSP